MRNRGMEEWMPFASLPEYQTELDRMLGEREKEERPLLSDEQAEEINSALCQLRPGDFLSLICFENGRRLIRTGSLGSISPEEAFLTVGGVKIRFDNIIGISHY